MSQIRSFSAREDGRGPAGTMRAAAMVISMVSAAMAQTAGPAPNSDLTYQALRNGTLGGEAVSVTNLELKRDAATFHLHSGTVCFMAPVQGKVTGAVFVGEGGLVLDPPQAAERNSLRLLTKEDEFSEKFEHMVLRFTDSTHDDIQKAEKAVSGGCDPELLKDALNTTRHKLKSNVEARILEEVLSPSPRPYFLALIHGKRYDDKELFEIDPDKGRYQVNFVTYDENKQGHWASLTVSDALWLRTFGKPIHIEQQQLDTTLEKNATLLGRATTTFVSLRNGLRVVPFNLFRPLRVQRVTADGQDLSFIQEDKNEDGDFAVILPRALRAGEKYTLTTVYGGKQAVSDEGGGNYFPVARDNWYPNDPGGAFGEYATYDLTFRIPKGMKMAATGVLVSESEAGGQNVSQWKSEAPQTVAGFSFGRFRVEQTKLRAPEYAIESYANQDAPDWVNSLKRQAEGDALPGEHRATVVMLGQMNTTGLNQKALAEGELAVQLYTEYFGPSLFKHMQITQQTACDFGQSWPELVWIPICYYFDTTVRHQLGLDWGDRGYWKVVTPHEVAHQWWGHTVGFAYGRDQWMSEGFADMSASLFITLVEKNPKKFIDFWNDERDMLLEKNAQGFRAIDVGPLTMGYRANNTRTGFDITRRLIYPKGAYILHMIRMMMHDNRTGDQQFKELMQDFVQAYRGRPATTEDFKAMVEKHMTREMDLEGNHRMDWFFDEYVYGTQLPRYSLDSSFDIGADGDVVFRMRLTQSDVDAKFRMLVPVYLEMDDGRLLALGRAPLVGSSTVEDKVQIKGLKTKPRRALVNYYDDVLAAR